MVITFPAEMDRLHEMLQLIRMQIKIAGFNEALSSKIELALEEALVNIIKHGYPKEPGDIQISIHHAYNGSLKISLKDHGIPYNPLENSIPFDPKASLENRSPGGYGIYFIHQLMDELEYKRDGKFNILTLTKNKK